MTENLAPSRRWLTIAMIGVALVVMTFIVVALVIWDKPDFGRLVTPGFLPGITSGVMVGAIILLVAAWKMPEMKRWQRVTLFVWALVALTSPAFGIMFLLPWGLLVLSLPVVLFILMNRATAQ